MWLVYLRFDDQGKVDTYHVRTANKATSDKVLKMAEKRGLSASSKLLEYAMFYASGTIKRKLAIVPNFHFYDYVDFVSRWKAVEADSQDSDN